MRTRAAVRAGVALSLAMGVVAAAGHEPQARAQTDGNGPAALEAADRAFKQALADEQADRCDKAVAELEEARALAHKETPQLLFHLGVCHVRLGRLVAARDELRAATERAQQQGLENVARTAKAQLDAVLPRVATLALGRPPAGAVKLLAIDGVDATARIGARMDLDPGEHRVDVSYTVGPTRSTRVTLREGEHADLAWPEGAPAEPTIAGTPPTSAVQPAVLAPEMPPGAAGTSAEQPSAPRSGSGLRTVGWIVGGGGVALLAGAGAFWALREKANSTLRNDCPGLGCPASDAGTISDGKLFDTLSVALFVAGGAALLSGAGLVLFGGGHTTTTPASGVRVVPLVGRAPGLGVSGELW